MWTCLPAYLPVLFPSSRSLYCLPSPYTQLVCGQRTGGIQHCWCRGRHESWERWLRGLGSNSDLSGALNGELLCSVPPQFAALLWVTGTFMLPWETGAFMLQCWDPGHACVCLLWVWRETTLQDLVLPFLLASYPSHVRIPTLRVSTVQEGAYRGTDIFYELSDGLAKSNPNATGGSQGKTCCVISQDKVTTAQVHKVTRAAHFSRITSFIFQPCTCARKDPIHKCSAERDIQSPVFCFLLLHVHSWDSLMSLRKLWENILLQDHLLSYRRLSLQPPFPFITRERGMKIGLIWRQCLIYWSKNSIHRLSC